LESMGRAFLGALLGVIAVLLISGIAAFLYRIPRFEGAYATSVLFVWLPVGGIAGALFGLLLAKRSR